MTRGGRPRSARTLIEKLDEFSGAVSCKLDCPAWGNPWAKTATHHPECPRGRYRKLLFELRRSTQTTPRAASKPLPVVATKAKCFSETGQCVNSRACNEDGRCMYKTTPRGRRRG